MAQGGDGQAGLSEVIVLRPSVTFRRWSGRGDSNPRLSAWEADTLPLSYARPVPTVPILPSRGASINPSLRPCIRGAREVDRVPPPSGTHSVFEEPARGIGSFGVR